jgi:hypothetical protein
MVVGPAAEHIPMVRQGYEGRLHRDGGLVGSEAAWTGTSIETKANTSRERLVRNKRTLRGSSGTILSKLYPTKRSF